MQALGPDDAQAAVGVAQHQHGIGLGGHHQLVALGNDVAHGLAQVTAHGLHVYVGIGQLEVLEEHSVEVVVVVLPRMRQQAVKVRAALVDDRRQSYNLRARAHNDQELQFSVVFELCHIFDSLNLYWGRSTITPLMSSMLIDIDVLFLFLKYIPGFMFLVTRRR